MIRKMEGCSKHQAIMKAKHLIDPTKYPLTTKKKESNATSDKGEALSRIAVLTKYYRTSLAALNKSKRARAYAESRGLPCAKLGIGYSGADMGKTWNTELQKTGEQVGIMRKTRTGSYAPKLRYCLLFAMKNKAGQVVDVYGRSIKDKTKSRHFYLPGGQQGLYPGYPKLESRTLILTESIIDAASLLAEEAIKNEYAMDIVLEVGH